MIKILVVDDHALIREGLKRIVSDTDDMKIVGEATSAQEIVEMAMDDKWEADLVLLDITLPGRSGLDVLKQLKDIRPGVAVLVLSIHPEDQYALRVLRTGASGYMTKDSAPEQLIEAIRKVHRGGKYVSDGLAEKLASLVGDDFDLPRHATLSDREFQVMCMIASGKTVSEIAKKLALSVNTVSTYRSRVLQKMKMKTNAQLTYYVMRQRLID